jgi:5S rRNA maturation endonuclease (ribonuclease M5)
LKISYIGYEIDTIRKEYSKEVDIMLDFNQFIDRHGEIVVQALIENMERFEGLRVESTLPLVIRWQNLFARVSEQRRVA